MTDSDSNPYECVVNYSGSDWFHGDKQRLQSPFSLLAVANASVVKETLKNDVCH